MNRQHSMEKITITKTIKALIKLSNSKRFYYTFRQKTNSIRMLITHMIRQFLEKSFNEVAWLKTNNM